LVYETEVLRIYTLAGDILAQLQVSTRNRFGLDCKVIDVFLVMNQKTAEIAPYFKNEQLPYDGAEAMRGRFCRNKFSKPEPL
jgi:hypothetical protein